MAWTRLLTVAAILAVLVLPFVPAWAAPGDAGGEAGGIAAVADSLPDDIDDDPASESTEAEALAPVLVVDPRHGWPGPPGRLVARHGPALLAGPAAPPPRGPRTA